ncbi:MAG TPA: hypothetical protein VK358_00035, partial [Longimicrobium sp.]|nr:hypothetical protein [Longimicrobium sp.]
MNSRFDRRIDHSMEIDVAEFEALAGSFLPSRLIVWAGAGISLDAPTRLPLGFGLTEFALEETCGTATSTRLFDLWESANEICSEGDRRDPFSWRPRLESVLGGLSDLERDAVEPSLAFMPAFTSFADAPPNAVHFSIASMVLGGASVFTANFDLCLQRAVRSLAGTADPFEVDVSGSIRRYRLKPGVGEGEIVHFHGAADDPEYLGATLGRIKQGLPEPFAVLEDRLRAGSLLVMVGYSASDSFDVNPYFVRQPRAAWPASTLVYVRHEGREAPAQLPALAVGFGRWAEVSAHTGLLMSALAGRLHPVDESPAFDWRAEFRARLAPAPGEGPRALRTCAVANALGINVDALDGDAYARAEAANPGYEPGRYHHLLAIAGRERGDAEKELEHHLLAGDGERETMGYAYARGDLQSAREQAMSTEEILHMARVVPGELPWAPYTSMSAHARPLVSRYLLRPWRRPRGRDLTEIGRLLEVAEVLGSRPMRGVQFVRQIATAWRFGVLLGVLAGRSPEPQQEKRIRDLYAELADLAGFVSSYRDFAMVRLLCV